VSARPHRVQTLPSRWATAALTFCQLPLRRNRRAGSAFTPLLFPGKRGGHLNLHNWRRDEWKPALTAAGLDYRKPYALRHTFVSECIAAGIATFEIARMAGTSVLQIEKTYGHLLPDAIERGRGALDAFDVRAEAFGQLSGNAD
jgi:integrase